MTLDYSPFLATLDAGQVWAFRLTANPSYSAPRGPEVRGKRYGHVTVEQQRRWLIERTPRYGFELVPLSGAAVDDAASGDAATGDADADAVAASASVVVVRRETAYFLYFLASLFHISVLIHPGNYTCLYCQLV